jgi:hypothetical protein
MIIGRGNRRNRRKHFPVSLEFSTAVIPYSRIWEVFGSNLGRDTGYTEVSVMFFRFSGQMPG